MTPIETLQTKTRFVSMGRSNGCGTLKIRQSLNLKVAIVDRYFVKDKDSTPIFPDFLSFKLDNRFILWLYSKCIF